MPGNYMRAQVTGNQTVIGDWWYNRYFEITCNDPLKRCKNDPRAYEDDPATPENTGKYPRINLCDVGREFWDLKTLKTYLLVKRLDEKVKLSQSGDSPSNNVASLNCQWQTLLHEMLHTVAETYAGGYEPGISQPKLIDVKPKPLVVEKAYGANRANLMARLKTSGKQRLVISNVDNYGYYTLSTYMMQTLNMPYPTDPPATWNGTAATAGDDGADPEQTTIGPLIL